MANKHRKSKAIVLPKRSKMAKKLHERINNLEQIMLAQAHKISSVASSKCSDTGGSSEREKIEP